MIPIYRDIVLSLTAEQQRLKEAVHGFAKEVLRPASISLDRLGDPAQVIDPYSELWETLGTAYKPGFHTALFPVEYGATTERFPALLLHTRSVMNP